MALAAVAAFALSLATLMALTRFTAYSSLSWLYRVTLDRGTDSSCDAWLVSSQAFHLTWSLLVASIMLNGREHWLTATGQQSARWLITVISMTSPAILGVVTQLALGLGRPNRHAYAMDHPAGSAASHSPNGGNTETIRHSTRETRSRSSSLMVLTVDLSVLTRVDPAAI